MRWVVELPAETGESAPTIAVDGESWKAALSVARNGKSLPQYRCDFDEDGTIRVHDFATNERFALRPLKMLTGPELARVSSIPPLGNSASSTDVQSFNLPKSAPPRPRSLPPRQGAHPQEPIALVNKAPG